MLRSEISIIINLICQKSSSIEPVQQKIKLPSPNNIKDDLVDTDTEKVQNKIRQKHSNINILIIVKIRD